MKFQIEIPTTNSTDRTCKHAYNLESNVDFQIGVELITSSIKSGKITQYEDAVELSFINFLCRILSMNLQK